MANVKISELPVASSVGATDSFPLVQGGTTKQGTKAVLLDDLGTPSSVTLTNATGLPLTTGVTGTLPTGNGGTGLTSFTANGVVYASSGSALATGSALTFDGTNLGVGGAPTTFGKLDVRNGVNYRVLVNGLAGYGNNAIAAINDSGAETHLGLAGTPIAFYVQAAEQMRLTSTGLGIGTSSPGAKLHVESSTVAIGRFQGGTGAGNGAYAGFYGQGAFAGYIGTQSGIVGSGTSNNLALYAAGSNSITLWTGGTQNATLDSSGNLGLGVTPSAWVNYKPLQAGSGASFGGYAGDVLSFMGSNTYNDNTNWKYILGGNAAARYQQSGGVHAWYTAPSGTAGNAISFTQALTLDANRNLLLNGTTAPASGVGSFAIFNGTAPTGSVTDGCVLYTEDVSSSSELKVRDEAGNVTTLSPHNFELIPEGPSEDMAWSYYSERDGKRINVDMLKAIRLLEKLSGEKLVFEA